MKKALIGLVTFIFANSAIAYVDLSVNYTFSQRKIEGAEVEINQDPGEAVTRTEGWSINWGWYLWGYTAIEFNYSNSKERLIDDREVATDDASITILKIDSLVETEVIGAGIRQAFASKESLFIPSIAVGYAKFITSGSTVYTIDDGTDVEDLNIERDKEVANSSYITAQLRIRLTKLMGFTFAAKSVMPDFDTSVMTDNLIYSAGFSWVF